MLERLFRLRDHGTTVETEVLGGITTFVTMAYIIVVNPAILAFAQVPVGPRRWPRSWRPCSARC